MTAAELREKIKLLVPQVYSNKQKAEKAAVEYDELTKFPELKAVIIDLLTSDFDSFLSSIDWVAPRPTTFKVILPNKQYFNLIWNTQDFIVKVAGKKYDMLSLQERERAIKSLSDLIQYGPLNVNMSPEDLAQQNLTPAKGESSTPPVEPEEL